MDIIKIRKKAKELQQKKVGFVEKSPEISTYKGPVQHKESKPVTDETPVRADSIAEQVVTGEERQKTIEITETEQTKIDERLTEQIPEELSASDELLDEEKIVFEMPQIEVLEFVLGDEEYGVILEDVREIIRIKPITQVPRTPVFVKGILSLRGTMIPVIDLKMRLKLGETQIGQTTRIVIASDDTRFFGVIVDKINGVIKIMEDMIEPTPPTISADVSEFIRGLGKYGEKLVRLLDLHKVSIFEMESI